jgi:hypothetical protein
MFDGPTPLPRRTAHQPFKAVLINPYELGRQPFALAEPAAWLTRAGCDVACIDLSLDRLDPAVLADAGLVAIHVGMHTATRIAVEALPRIRELAPQAHLCVYGLYAPVNESLLRSLGAATILGGECEPQLRDLALQLAHGRLPAPRAEVNLARIEFLTPRRDTLPPLKRYAHLELPDGGTRVVGFVDASRGCKHLCRHCPVVPVYQGRFRVVPADIVLSDIRQQVAAGAQHLSFGDPDFLNGPTHALKVVRALHREFPGLTYDAIIKVEHLIRHAELLPELARSGCLFITSAVEAVDDRILGYLDKHHTAADFERAVHLLRAAGIAFAPTFVAFTPWTTLDGYVDLLRRLVALKLVAAVPPIQLAIRLLVPRGSYLLQLPGFEQLVRPFNPVLLGHPWTHRDARVDALQRDIETQVADAAQRNQDRRETFNEIWRTAHAAAGRAVPDLAGVDLGQPVLRLSEPWYCCAEPTQQQLASF